MSLSTSVCSHLSQNLRWGDCVQLNSSYTRILSHCMRTDHVYVSWSSQHLCRKLSIHSTLHLQLPQLQSTVRLLSLCHIHLTASQQQLKLTLTVVVRTISFRPAFLSISKHHLVDEENYLKYLPVCLSNIDASQKALHDVLLRSEPNLHGINSYR